MRGNRSRDTKPELIVRRLLFSLGFRYRLHGATLPGKPDIVFASRRKVIFVHGCFWHQHKRCWLLRPFRTKQQYWAEKLRRNVVRDAKNRRELRDVGWTPLVVWECQLSDLSKVEHCLSTFLS